MKYQKSLPVSSGWDIIISGAGPAGCGAAIAAGKKGLKVLLLEAGTRAGGMGTAGNVSSYAPMSDGERCVAGGIARHVAQTLYERKVFGPQVTPDFWNKSVQRWIPFQPEELTLLYDELLAQAGVTVRYGSRTVDAEKGEQNGELRGVVVADVEGLHVARGTAFVDATGDATLTVAAGFPTWTAGTDTERIMPPTLCGLFSGIRWEDISMSPHGNCPSGQQAMLEKAIDENKFSRSDRHMPGLYRIGYDMGMMNAGHLFNTDATKTDSLSQGYIAGRKLIREYLAFFREYIPGCEDMQLVSTGPLMGIRESRRIKGEYVLNYDDYRARRRFDDNIGISSGKVDIHVYDDSPEEYERYYKEFNEIDHLGLGESFGLPYRILIPKGSRNLLVAGRCVSCDIKVQGALRVQPYCTVMGEAAGTAMAQLIHGSDDEIDVHSVNIANLQKTLLDGGSILD